MRTKNTAAENGADVRRDMGYARELLLRIEDDPKCDGTRWFPGEVLLSDGHSFDELAYHLNLLRDAGLIHANLTAHRTLFSGLTWEGHEFLDDTRDPTIWAEAQEKAKVVKPVLALLCCGNWPRPASERNLD